MPTDLPLRARTPHSARAVNRSSLLAMISNVMAELGGDRKLADQARAENLYEAGGLNGKFKGSTGKQATGKVGLFEVLAQGARARLVTLTNMLKAAPATRQTVH